MNPELVFRRQLVLANCREDVTVEKVLSFPIDPNFLRNCLDASVLFVIFSSDNILGTHRDSCVVLELKFHVPRKTSKADLVHQLEQNVSIIQTLPIFDISRTILIDQR